jgi:Ni,Fe-hydrogenase III small subunit
MPKIWVLRGIKKGIVTTKFPKAKSTNEEIPTKSIPPTATENSNWSSGEKVCPTGAIQSNLMKINLEKCIYCQRCESSGFNFESADKGPTAALQAFTTLNEKALKKLPKNRLFSKSFHVLMIDVGSCNACNLEVMNLANPYYDLNRLGIFFTNSVKHADALIVVGALNKSMVDVLKRTYDSMPEPKLVIAVGACAISGGIFQSSESFVSPIQAVLPVDVVVPGCPPSPIQILEGLLLAMGRLEKPQSQSRDVAKEVA